jgi:hypothetical protein
MAEMGPRSIVNMVFVVLLAATLIFGVYETYQFVLAASAVP